MRRLVLLFAVLGAAGAWAAGVSARSAIVREMQSYSAAEAEAVARHPRIRAMRDEGSALLAAAPLGIAGGVLAVRRRRVAAAAVLLAAYAVPATILAGRPAGIPPAALFAPVGLAVAGVLALFLPPAPARPVPAHRFGHPVGYDMVR